jgi:hypothetical protein
MLVGRAGELAAVAACLEKRRPLAVLGEAGIGKTTLLEEAARRSGHRIFEGGGLATLSRMRYLPLVRALGRSLPESGPVALAAWLARSINSGVLFLDDLQWADTDTSALLVLLAGRVPLLAAIRCGDPGATRARAEAEGAGFTLVRLEGLPDADAEALVRLHRPDLPAQAVRLVVCRAEGNPRLLEELSIEPELSKTLPLSAGDSGLTRVYARLALAYADAGDDVAARAALERALPLARTNAARCNILSVKAEINWLAGRAGAALASAAECLGEGAVNNAGVAAALVGAWAALDLGVSPALELPRTKSTPLIQAPVVELAGIRRLEQPGSARKAECLLTGAARLWAGRALRSEVRCLWGAGEAALRGGALDRAQTLLLAAEDRATSRRLVPLLCRIHGSLRHAGVPRAVGRSAARGKPRAPAE